MENILIRHRDCFMISLLRAGVTRTGARKERFVSDGRSGP